MCYRVCFGVLAGSATISSVWEIKGSLVCCLSHFLMLGGGLPVTSWSRGLSRWVVVLACLADRLGFHVSSQAISSARRAVWAGNVTFRTKWAPWHGSLLWANLTLQHVWVGTLDPLASVCAIILCIYQEVDAWAAMSQDTQLAWRLFCLSMPMSTGHLSRVGKFLCGSPEVLEVVFTSYTVVHRDTLLTEREQSQSREQGDKKTRGNPNSWPCYSASREVPALWKPFLLPLRFRHFKAKHSNLYIDGETQNWYCWVNPEENKDKSRKKKNNQLVSKR